METFLKKAKSAAHIMATMEPAQKNSLLLQMADALEANITQILEANAIDMKNGKTNGLTSAMLDRLLLNDARVQEMATAIREIAALKEPVGRVIDGWIVESGLRIEKVSIPIGVVGIIYESRPNVTSDTAALCFKSGNVCVLKGGKEADESNHAIAEILRDVLEENGIPEACISLLPDGSREGVAKLIKMDKYVDLIVPRGGEGLIRFVSENASVPVVKHDKGLCHIYIDKEVIMDDAIKIAINAKCQRPSACNAMETLLVHDDIARELLPRLKKAFDKKGTELRGCPLTCKLIEAVPATEKDYDTEYLSNILTIKVVSGVDDAIVHIAQHGSGHSEAILTTNHLIGEKFLNAVDASSVYINASTRFTDGGEFGFGAEVGISTNKLHARGPMGINELTTYKFKIYGKGHVRA